MAVLSCVGMMLPATAMAANVPVSPANGIDIALADGGLFVGQVVDAQGAPLRQSEVVLTHHGKPVVRTQTDKNGMFAAQGLRGGQYEVVTANSVVPCRLWAAQTAPPTARSSALIVTGSQIVNGQSGIVGGGVLSWMQAHPIIVAGAVVAAIAIPLAVADNDDDAPTSP